MTTPNPTTTPDLTGPDPNRHHFLIQLPLTTNDLTTALRLARVIARSLTLHKLVDGHHTTVTTTDHPDIRHPAFCPHPQPNGQHCQLHPEHDGPCTRRLPR